MSSTRIDHFVKKLSKQKVSNETRNIYAGRSHAAVTRRNNLLLYLNQMVAQRPTNLLVGEAPGYKGCGLTGVPFSSERILTENAHFKDHGYQCLNEDDNLESENSATIVWNTLIQYPTIPLIWNIYPFHPHKASNKKSNRAPRADELQVGLTFVKDLLTIYPITKIIAVGRKAELMIQHLEYDYAYVRHPSHGGKHKFVNGLKDELLQ